MDLVAVFPHIAVGGAIVFDNLDYIPETANRTETQTQYPEFYPPLPEGLHSLKDVWEHAKARYPNFVYIEGAERGNPPVTAAIGIRVS